MPTVPGPGQTDAANPGAMFIATKIVGPRGGERYVARPRLLKLLGVPPAYPVTLVHGGAGFGKTSCLAQWILELAKADVRVAWLSLDSDDDDVHMFIAYVAAAINQARPEIGRDVIELVSRKGARSGPALLLRLLVNALASIREPLVLILDDYHLLSEPAVHDWFAEFIAHVPDHCFIVVSARTLPPLRLARLRASARVGEVGPEDLAFSYDEVRAFMQSSGGIDLRASELSDLHERTEGWAAGMQMVAIAARGKRNVGALIGAFRGDARAVSNYMQEQVIGSLTPEMRSFLMRTAILERLCPDVCDAILGTTGNGRLIDETYQRGLFLYPLDETGHWYRYHHLFADCLLAELRRTEPDELTRGHLRASEWFAERNFWHEAVRHAIHAGDQDRALSIANRCAMELVRDGDYMVLQSLLRKLPEAMRGRGVALQLAEAWVLALNGEAARVERILSGIGTTDDAADTPGREKFEPEIRAIRLTLAYIQDDSAQVSKLIHGSQARSPAEQPWVADVLKCGASVEHIWHGRLAAARDFSPCETPLKRVFQLMLFGTSWWYDGQVTQAESQWQAAADLAESETGAASLAAILPHTLLGRLEYERGRFDSVQRTLSHRVALLEEVSVTDLMVQGVYALAWSNVACGNIGEATALLDRMRQLAAERGWVRMEANATIELLRLCVRTQPDQAAHLADRLHAIGPAVARKSLSTHWVGARLCALGVAFCRAMSGGSADSLRVLEAVAHDLMECAHAPDAVTAGLLLAWASQENGDRAQALRVLGQTLLRAQGLGIVQTFIDSGPWATSLLRELSQSGAPGALGLRRAYIDQLLPTDVAPAALVPAATRRGVATVHHETLSNREREILELIARGLCNKDIARALKIEVGTVKWHVKNVYAKLGAANRMQAVNRARAGAMLA